MAIHDTRSLNGAIAAHVVVNDWPYADASTVNALFDGDKACCDDEGYGDGSAKPQGDRHEIPDMSNEEWAALLAEQVCVEDFTDVPTLLFMPLYGVPTSDDEIAVTPSCEGPAAPALCMDVLPVPISNNAVDQTAETCETYTGGNEEFLREVFGS
jgi:hypothetical protein